jgi:hypothetical protein
MSQARGFLRDTGAMGSSLDRHSIRIAMKDGATNRRMVEIPKQVLTKMAESSELAMAK